MAATQGMGLSWSGQLLLFLLTLLTIAKIQAAFVASHNGTLTPKIRSLHIYSDIKFRFATTLVTSRVLNPDDYPRQALFDVILPEAAFISNFTLDIDGRVYNGVVRRKGATERRYELAKKRGQSSGYVAAKPRETNSFKIEVNVAPRSQVTFNLTYQEVLTRRRGIYQHVIHFNPGQLIEDLKVEVSIRESRDITMLRVPPIRVQPIEVNGKDSSLAVIEQPDARSAYVRFQPSLMEQKTHWSQGVRGRFVVEYDVERNYDAGDVLVVNGYFVHFFAPRVETSIPKDILFVLDLSTSMTGRKVLQLKEAMKTILADLRDGDRFNILLFNTETWFWDRTQIVPATAENVQRAQEYVDQLRVDGFTNIEEALTEGLNFLNRHTERQNRSMMIFLTDGQPTHGLLVADDILKKVRGYNMWEIPIFSLAFGEAADWLFIKRVAIQNNGIARRIYEASDAALQITGFYDEVSTTLLTGVSVNYLEDAVDPQSVTSSMFKNYFQGSEFVVAGRISPNATSLPVQVLGTGLDGAFQAYLNAGLNTLSLGGVPELIDPREFEEITEKVWAYLTIKQLIRRRDGTSDLVLKSALEQQILDLSLKYQFVTIMTTMVVTKPGIEDTTDEDLETSETDVIARGRWSGRAGRDPHFMVNGVGLVHPLCFDVIGKPYDVFQVIKDPRIGLVINMRVNHGYRVDGHNKKRTYIKEVAVMFHNMLIHARVNGIRVNRKRFTWDSDVVLKLPAANVVIKSGMKSLRVEFHNGLLLKVRKHVTGQGFEAYRDEFLNFDLDNEEKLSHQVTGILGQYVHGEFAVKDPIEGAGKNETSKLIIRTDKGVRKTNVTLETRHDPIRRQMLKCWFIHQNASTLFQINGKKFLQKIKRGV